MDQKFENIFQYMIRVMIIILTIMVMGHILVMMLAVLAIVLSAAFLILVNFGAVLIPAGIAYLIISKLLKKYRKYSEGDTESENDNASDKSEQSVFEETEYTEPILKTLQESRVLREKVRMSQEKQEARRIFLTQELLKSDKVSSIFKDYSNLEQDDFKTVSDVDGTPDYTWKRSDDG